VAQSMMLISHHTCYLTHSLLGYNIFVLGNRPKTSSCLSIAPPPLLRPEIAKIGASTLLATTSQLLEQESCSNPLRMQQPLSKSKNKFFVLVLSFSGGNVTSRGVFASFQPSLPGPGRHPNGPFFGLKI